MKKLFVSVLMAATVLTFATGCGKTDTKTEKADAFDASKPITVISREDGSGTRGAFIELFGIQEKTADGKKVDHTTEEASITNNTSVMMTTVAGDEYAIGYISLGSLNDTVKTLKIDGTEATVDNIKSGTYKISRPFNIATKGKVSDSAKEFISFILSADGQAVIEKEGYIKISKEGAFKSTNPTGKVVVAGSSSVTPVMEKLKEAYLKLNKNVTIEIQQSDSTTGMTSTIDGICDIGMASRELSDSEKQKGITSTTIAMDGIAVIVNKASTIDTLTTEQVKEIYTGKTTEWSGVTAK